VKILSQAGMRLHVSHLLVAIPQSSSLRSALVSGDAALSVMRSPGTEVRLKRIATCLTDA
jgi:hypothetical protein